MTELELLEDTIAYYSVNPSERRCIDIVCHYSPKTANKPTSEGCAIGRHLSNDVKKKFDGVGGNVYFVKYTDSNVFSLAPKWMQEMNIRFLSAIQSLHDAGYYWCEDGLSEKGKAYVEQIKEKFGL